MDVEAVRKVEEELLAWGIVERRPHAVLTRRFRAAIARAANELAQEEQRPGERPPTASDPISTAVDRAFTHFPLPAGSRIGPEHRIFALGLEIASLPPAALALILRKD